MGAFNATVRKLPKTRRVPQAWQAECDSHMGLMHQNVKLRLRGSGYEVWRGLQRRRAMDARKDAERHNAEHHPGGRES